MLFGFVSLLVATSEAALPAGGTGPVEGVPALPPPDAPWKSSRFALSDEFYRTREQVEQDLRVQDAQGQGARMTDEAWDHMLHLHRLNGEAMVQLREQGRELEEALKNGYGLDELADPAPGTAAASR